ncbi:MAG: hypothetical protein ACYCWA_06935 [Thiobacillus sp.]
MKNGKLLIGALALSLMLPGAGALAEETGVATPQTVEGQVAGVDLEQGKLRIRAIDGTLHEFQASRETLEGYKVGDPIKAKLRASAHAK